MKPIENVLTRPAPARAIIATTLLESMPPDRNAPSGTSAMRRSRTASSKCATSSACNSAGRRAKRELSTARDPGSRRKELVTQYTTRFANPYVAAERGYIDDVIEPSQTRRELVRGLQLCLRKTVERPPRKHGNIPL